MSRLPVNIRRFRDFRPSTHAPEGYAYIDKTPLIATMAREPAHLFLARPRRFGKSLLVSTLAELFQGNREMFRGTWIYDDAHWDWKHNTLPVLQLTMGLRNIHDPVELEQALCRYMWRLAGDSAFSIFQVSPPLDPERHIFRQTPAEMLEQYLNHLAQTRPAERSGGSGVVVLVDEYDIPINENLQQDRDKVTAIVDVMRAFYGVLKDYPGNLRFTLVTGIARFARTGLFSGANHLVDITASPRFSTLLGITQEDLNHGFWQPFLETAALNMQTQPEGLYQALARHYNGYRFAPDSEPVYNPWSLLQCLDAMQYPEEARNMNMDNLPNYWAESGNTGMLQRVLQVSAKIHELPPLLDPAIEHLRQRRLPVAPQPTAVVQTIVRTAYDVQNPDFTALLYQTGYLTHARRQKESGTTELCLDFPNREIIETFRGPLMEWLRQHLPSAANAKDWPLVSPLAMAWRQAWLQNNAQAFYQACNQYLARIPYPLHPHRDRVTVLDREYFYQALLYSWTDVLGFHPLVEIPSRHGRADLIADTLERIWIVEIRTDSNAVEAVRQALLRGYDDAYTNTPHPVTLVGLQIDTYHRQAVTCVQWDLGIFDPERNRWQNEPFAIPLAEVNLAADEKLPTWPFQQELDIAPEAESSEDNSTWANGG